MRNALHEMLAVTLQLRYPDIFVTITCNPNLPEKMKHLKPGKTPANRPDLCARLFHMKEKSIIQHFFDEEIFGKFIAHFKVISLQKRSLPHAQCIFIRDLETKKSFKNALAVDDIILTEMLPESDPELRIIALDKNIHVPCGSENQRAVCIGIRKKKKRRNNNNGIFDREENEENSHA